MGYSRRRFSEIRSHLHTCGAEGLIDRLPDAKGPQPNRVAAEIETAILDHALPLSPAMAPRAWSRNCACAA